jgi:hypothetical protein
MAGKKKGGKKGLPPAFLANIKKKGASSKGGKKK